MKNESEEQCSHSGQSSVPGTSFSSMSVVEGVENSIMTTQELHEDFSSLNICEKQADGPWSVSGWDTTTGALSTTSDGGAVTVNELSCTECVRDSQWRHCCEAELSAKSTHELKMLLRQLRSRIEDVSTELVALLQVRQSLREEVPIRNVTIAQLLKVHEQLQLSLTEPLAVQMSVIFPDQNEALDCL